MAGGLAGDWTHLLLHRPIQPLLHRPIQPVLERPPAVVAVFEIGPSGQFDFPLVVVGVTEPPPQSHPPLVAPACDFLILDMLVDVCPNRKERRHLRTERKMGVSREKERQRERESGWAGGRVGGRVMRYRLGVPIH